MATVCARGESLTVNPASIMTSYTEGFFTAEETAQGFPIFRGHSGDDEIWGTHIEDVIFGGSGNDLIRAVEGDDALKGELGDDILYGGEGDDTLLGGLGDDKLYGGDGRDFLIGSYGDDTLIGGAGSDVFFINAGNNIIEDFNTKGLTVDFFVLGKFLTNVKWKQDGGNLLISSDQGVTTILNADVGDFI